MPLTYWGEVAADTPVIWHKLETGYTSVGSLSPSTLSTPLSLSTGARGNGAVFNGTGDYIQDTTTSAYYGTSWAVEAWFKCNSTNDYNTIVRRSGAQHVLLRVRGSAIGLNPNKLECYVSGNGGSVTSFVSTINVNDNAWHHGVLVQDNATSLINMYIDGSLNATGSTVGTISSLQSPQQIGREASGTEYFKGMLDEVAIYDHALSATRVAAHYNAPFSFPAFKGWGLPL